MAFDLGLEGVVVLPPYYFRNVSDEGLFAWYSAVICRAVPAGGALLGYHIPPVTGVPLSFDLLARLRDAFPDRFAGLKDSSADAGHAHALGERFGDELLVLNGNDRLLSLALEHGAAGSITNLSSLQSPDLRQVWDAYRAGSSAPEAQARLETGRQFLDRYPPAPPFLKAMLPRLHGLPQWTVRPPLLPMPPEMADRAAAAYCAAVE
jgi:4-hydroxy-tetrahydrodipicolinate synthase